MTQLVGRKQGVKPGHSGSRAHAPGPSKLESAINRDQCSLSPNVPSVFSAWPVYFGRCNRQEDSGGCLIPEVSAYSSRFWPKRAGFSEEPCRPGLVLPAELNAFKHLLGLQEACQEELPSFAAAAVGPGRPFAFGGSLLPDRIIIPPPVPISILAPSRHGSRGR